MCSTVILGRGVKSKVGRKISAQADQLALNSRPADSSVPRNAASKYWKVPNLKAPTSAELDTKCLLPGLFPGQFPNLN